MGFASKTVNICQFRVVGIEETTPAQAIEIVGRGLTQNAFVSIDKGSDEVSSGWVQMEDMESTDFSNINDYQREDYLFFALRRDQRKISSAVLKRKLEQASTEFLAEHPSLKRVPKQRREEMREAIRGSLMAATFPTPSSYDIVWDLRTHTVSLFTTSTKIAEQIQSLFTVSFEGLRLVPLSPFERARQLLEGHHRERLDAENQASSEAAMDMINQNVWLGHDFLASLLYRTVNGGQAFAVCTPGPFDQNTGFEAHLDDRLVFVGSCLHEAGKQKVVVSGPQDRFGESVTALREGKNIAEAKINLQNAENIWKVTLKADAFTFCSFRTPFIATEKDEVLDESTEKVARFYDKVYAIETGIQMIESILKTFLVQERLDAQTWNETSRNIRQWSAQEQAA